MNNLYTYGLELGLEHQKTLLGEPLRERINLSGGRLKFNLGAFLARAAGRFGMRMAELGDRACVGIGPACDTPFTA